MYNSWMFQAHFISLCHYRYTLQNEAARVTQQEMFHWVQNLKRTSSMENQKHIYSDLHEYSPPVWPH